MGDPVWQWQKMVAATEPALRANNFGMHGCLGERVQPTSEGQKSCYSESDNLCATAMLGTVHHLSMEGIII